MFESLFYCERREMPVAKDTTDCIGCGLRAYPSPCQQFEEHHRAVMRGSLGYVPEIFADKMPRPDLTE